MTNTTTPRPDGLLARIEAMTALCEAATDGPWEYEYRYSTVHFHDWLMTSENGQRLIFAVQVNTLDNPYAKPSDEDMAHIASHSPDTMRAVWAVAKAAELQRQTWTNQNVTSKELFDTQDAVNAALLALRDALAGIR